MPEPSILQQRQIEASIIATIHEELCKRVGVTEADQIIASAIKKEALAFGKRLAEESETNDLFTLYGLLDRWREDGALEISLIGLTSETLEFNVTRCRYAEAYKKMGLGIGHLLSCQRDGTFCEGFNPEISFSRTQTIMEGASHCDFRYRLR